MASTLVGAIAGAAAGELDPMFPGGIYKDAANAKRAAGPFLVLGREETASIVNTSGNRIECREITAHIYGPRADQVTALMEDTWKPWFLANPITVDRAAFMGAQVGGDEPVDETTDYAPQGGGARLNRAGVKYRCWLSFPTR